MPTLFAPAIAIGAEAAVPAAIGAEAAVGAGLGAGEALGAGAGLGADLFGAGAASSVFGGAGETALLSSAGIGGEAAGALGVADALGSAVPELTSGIGAMLGGGDLTPGFSMGGDVLVGGTPGGVTGAGAAPLSTGAGTAIQPVSFSGAATGASPAAAAPVAPAGIEASPTVTGQLGGSTDLASAGSFGGGGDVGSTASTVAKTAGSGFDNFLNKNLGVNTKDLGMLTSLGGLGMNFMNRDKPIPGEQQVKNAAGSLSATAAAQGAQGAHLESFINSGTLPPGLANGLKTATDAAHATIRSGYAARGMSGSSAEAQDLQAASDRAVAAGQSVALQLLQQGASMVGQAANTEGMAANLYEAIMRDALTRDAALGSAIGSFSGALAGMGNTGTAKAA